MRLCYKLVIHDLEEFDSIYHLLRDRKFAILADTACEDAERYWVEFPNENVDVRELIEEQLNLGYEWVPYLFIRVYFNTIPSIEKFKRRTKRLLKPVSCGNYECDNEHCQYHYTHMKNGDIPELLWRCIKKMERDYKFYDGDEIYNDGPYTIMYGSERP